MTPRRRVRSVDGDNYVDFDVDDGYLYKASTATIDLTQTARVYENGYLVQNTALPSSMGVRKSLTGQELPNWRSLVAANVSATTPLTAELQWVERGGLLATVLWEVAGTQYHTEYSGPSTHNFVDTSLPFSDDADQLARIKFYKRLRNQLIDMAGGPFLGEFGKTMNSIRRPARALSDMAEDYAFSAAKAAVEARRRSAGYGSPSSGRGGKTKPLGKRAAVLARDTSRRASDAWLSFTFGALPLVGDITGGAKALAELVETPMVRRVAAKGEAYGSRFFTVNKSISAWGYVLPLYYVLDVEDNAQDIVIYRAGLKQRMSLDTPLDHLIHLGGRFGLSPGELISTAYELAPWSFLLDYFSTLGDVVNAAAISTADISWVNTTRRTIYERKTRGRLDEASTAQAYAARGWKFKGIVGDVYKSHSSSKNVSRQAIPSVPLPRLEFRSNLSPMKLANIAALLAGLL